MISLTVADYQMIWLVGVVERLAILGFIQNPPLQLSSESLDLFLELDKVENRNTLFECDNQIVDFFKVMAYNECPEVSEEDVEQIGELILEYKNHRYQMVKYALDNIYNK